PHVTLAVARQAPARRIQRGLEADAGERVEQRLALRRAVADAAACDDLEAARPRSVDASSVLALFARIEVALHLGAQALGAEVCGEEHELLRRAVAERHEPFAQVGELRRRDPAFLLAGCRVTQREQAAEV